jgi:hypothetical protein
MADCKFAQKNASRKKHISMESYFSVKLTEKWSWFIMQRQAHTPKQMSGKGNGRNRKQ